MESGYSDTSSLVAYLQLMESGYSDTSGFVAYLQLMESGYSDTSSLVAYLHFGVKSTANPDSHSAAQWHQKKQLSTSPCYY